jgi:plastocyanin
MTALAIAGVASAVAAPAAVARTKVVYAGGPPPKAATQAPGIRFPAALDLNGFYGRRATIHVGDSIRWVFSHRVVHTVTFLATGQAQPPLEQPDAANPYTGFADSTGAPMWFDGQPSLLIPPDHAFPQGGATLAAQTFHNSGVSAPAFAPYTLKFTRAGTYTYLCLVHPGMKGKVKVIPKGRPIPTAKADRAARLAQFAADVKKARKLAKFTPQGNEVVAGHDDGAVSWFRFFPANRTIQAGQAVHFAIASAAEIHTITLGPQPSPDLILATPQPPGPPRLQFNPFYFLASDPTPQPYTGTNHGNGFYNTGIMDANPASPPPSSFDVTFTKPGSYLYECTIHPGMQARITVV